MADLTGFVRCCFCGLMSDHAACAATADADLLRCRHYLKHTEKEARIYAAALNPWVPTTHQE